MKKTIAILLIVALMAALSVTAFATGTGVLTASADNTTLSAGSEVTITIGISDCAPCKSAGLVFDYSDDIFESVSGSWAVTGTLMDYNAADKAAAYAVSNETTLSGDIFTLKLKVKAGASAGDATVTITPTVLNGESSVSCEGTSVTLTIEAGESNNLSADVKAKYNASTPADAYSVDIIWGAMEFDYNAGGQTWDAEAHKYTADENAPAAWAVHDSSNTITLTNNSSKAVSATFAFSADSGYSDITGVFTYNAEELTSALTLAKPAEDEAATPYVVSFMPSGTLASTHSSSSYAKIGSITISLD